MLQPSAGSLISVAIAATLDPLDPLAQISSTTVCPRNIGKLLAELAHHNIEW
jgi:hypothetical protein